MMSATLRGLARIALVLAVIVLVSCRHSSGPTTSGPAVILYEVTDTGGSAFIIWGDPDYLGEPTGAYYTTPWSHQFTADPGDAVFLSVEDTLGTPGTPVTIQMTIMKDSAVWDTYTWTNSSGSPESHMINEGLL